MFWLMCWNLGFLGNLSLLFSLLFSRTKYKSQEIPKPDYIGKGTNIYFVLLAFLIINTVIFDRLDNDYYILSIISGLIGGFSIISVVWLLIRTFGKTYISSGVIGPLIYKSNKALFQLDDGRYIQLIGVNIPNPRSEYRKMSEDAFHRMALKKVAKIEYDAMKSVGEVLFLYVYVNNLFINA